MSPLKKIFLNEHLMLGVILVNSVAIFLQESGYNPTYIKVIDIVCTALFIVEMAVKQHEYGIRGYWRDGWNRFDGILVILSIPAMVSYFAPDMLDFSRLLILRLLRVFRFFRVIHFFPNFSTIIRNVRLAIRQSFSVFVGFFVLIVVAGMINCTIFGNISPEYFGTPLDSIYSVFRICTVEGWYEIPDSIGAVVGREWTHLIRLYFGSLLFAGGIIGLSIVNSIFVDAMVSDNNDEVLRSIKSLQDTIDELQKKLEDNKKEQ